MKKVLADDLMKALFRFRNFSGGVPEGLGLRLPELFALKVIAKTGDKDAHCPSVLGGIRDELNITKPALSQLMNILETRGLVTREIDVNDRRRVDVSLTDAGHKAIKKAKHHRDKIFEDAITNLGEHKVEKLIKLLNDLSDALAQSSKNEGSSK
jgi:DNA-binding MarR family transcriptional regulator